MRSKNTRDGKKISLQDANRVALSKLTRRGHDTAAKEGLPNELLENHHGVAKGSTQQQLNERCHFVSEAFKLERFYIEVERYISV